MLPEVHLNMIILFTDEKYQISTNYLQKWTRNGGAPSNVWHLI
jgi:hypothetical protein